MGLGRGGEFEIEAVKYDNFWEKKRLTYSSDSLMEKMQQLLFPNRNDTINKFLYLHVQGYLFSDEQRDCPLFL